MRAFLALCPLLLLLGTADPAAAVKLTLAQDQFDQGSPIEFTVHNDGEQWIYFGSSTPYHLKNVETGETIGFVGLAVVLPVEPGRVVDFAILTTHGNIPPGSYELVVRYYVPEYEPREVAEPFTLRGVDEQTPIEPHSVGEAKARY